MLEPTGVSISGISAEEPSAGTSFGVKKKRENEEPSAGTSSKKFCQSMSSVAPPRIGKRPIFPVFVQKPSGGFVRIKALLDSGATTFCFSERFCSRYMIPKVQRDFPLRVADVAGRPVASGEAFTHLMKFQVSHCLFQQTFEIIPMEPGYDMIIPDWWREETGLSYRWSGSCSSME